MVFPRLHDESRLLNDFPDTSASLIAGIKNPENVTAWQEFEQLYRPVIFRIARSKGLQYADAFDLVQQVLFSVASAIDRYELSQDGAPFRNWLSRVTRNAILKALTRGPRDRGAGGTGVLDLFSGLPSPDPETTALIDLEYRRELFQRAAEIIRSEVQAETWIAFEMTVLQGKEIEMAAKHLQTSVGNIYASRSRVMKRLKAAVKRMEEN